MTNGALDLLHQRSLRSDTHTRATARENPIATKAPSSRPRVRKDRETREAEIVAAAFAVFTRDGLSAAKVEDIAEIAKVSKGTVYTYFETKEALFEAVLERYILATLEATMAQVSLLGTNCEDRLRSVLKGAYSLFAGPDIRKILILLIGEGGRFPGLIKFYHDNILARGREVLSAIIREGIDAGEFREIPIREYPQIVIGPGMMGAIWAHHFHEYSPLDLEGLYEAHMDLLIQGLRA